MNNIDLVWCNSEIKEHLYDAVTNENVLPWFSRAWYEIGQHRDKKCFFRKTLFFFIRFVLLMFGWTKNRYFTSNLWTCNPLRAFKDIKVSAKSVGSTYHIKFSDPINSALRTYSQSSNYGKQSVKPSCYR